MAVLDEEDRTGNNNPLLPADGVNKAASHDSQDKGGEEAEPETGPGEIARREGLDKPIGDENLDNSDKPRQKSVDRDDLRDKESSGSAVAGDADNAIPYHDEGKKAGFFKRSGKKMSSTRKKILLGVGAFAGVGVVGIIIFLIIIIASLQIPDFAQNILSYQFARVTDTFNQDAEQVTAEKSAIDSTDEGVFAGLQKTYGSVTDSWGNMWGKINNYSPSAVVDKLGTDGVIRYNYTPSTFLKDGKLSSVTFNAGKPDATTVSVKTGTFTNKLHPIDTFNSQANLASEVSDTLDTALQGRSILIRGLAENQIRKELNISLVAWVTGKYKGLDQQQAEAQDLQDSYTTTDDPSAATTAESSQVASAATQAEQELTNCVENTQCAEQIAANNGALPDTVANTIANTVSSASATSAFDTILGTINPIYKVATPICIIYEGSLEKSQPTIDAQNAELQRTFYRVETAADQIKAGNTNGEAVGALSWQLGDTSQSLAATRATGGTADTSLFTSPQASATGQFSLFNAVLQGTSASAIAGPLNAIANNCGLFTNVYLGVGIGIANLTYLIGSSFFGVGEASAGAEAAAEAGADAVATEVATQVAEQAATNVAQRSVVGTIKDLGTDIVKSTAKIAGATLIAHQIVASRMGAQHSGLGVGTSYANDADMGANLNANQVCQMQLYCRPLTQAELAASQSAVTQTANRQTSEQSSYQRYFAVSNANSLVTKLGTSVIADIHTNSISSFLAEIRQLFNPVSSLSKFASVFSTRVAKAQSTNNDDSTDYGIVQWGYSQDELNLRKTDPSYQPLENQAVLNTESIAWASSHNGQSLDDAIQFVYGKCFSDSMGTLLSGSDNNNNPEIVRDSHGNVLPDQGDCSPDNLGVNNPTFHDSVFRWRLSKAYESTIDQLSDVQNPV